MPTDNERREVARRLREFTKDNQWLLTVGGNSPTIRYAISDIVFGDKKYHSGVDLMDRLADLIEPEPERTCHDTDYSRESITCSECGEITMNTLYFVDLDGGYRTVKSHRPRFCSNCGARVIGEEAGDAD